MGRWLPWMVTVGATVLAADWIRAALVSSPTMQMDPRPPPIAVSKTNVIEPPPLTMLGVK